MFFPHSKADFQRIFNYYSFTHLRKELYNFLQIVYNEYFVHPKKHIRKQRSTKIMMDILSLMAIINLSQPFDFKIVDF